MATGDDIWIGVGSAIGVILFAGLAFALSQSTIREKIVALLGTFFFSLTNFIPFAFITFGLIADVIAQEFRYSLVSVTGFVAILVNYALKFFTEPMFGITSQVGGAEQGWCFIPGLESLESRATPMNIVSTAAIIVYLQIYASLNREIGQNVTLIIALPLMFALQFVTFWLGGCDAYYPSGFYGKLLALAIGSAVGASMYGFVNGVLPARAPFMRESMTNMKPLLQGSKGNSKSDSTKPNSDSTTGGKCAAANTDDDNAFVCEAYKNGQLVTESIT